MSRGICLKTSIGKEVKMWITDEFGKVYDVPTYCDIYECSECPRYGDDCDGEWEDDDELVE